MATKLNRNTRIEYTQGVLSVLPMILIILVVRGYPMTVALLRSFTDWDGFRQAEFVGIENYRYLVRSGEFWLLMRNSLLLLLYVPLQVASGLIVALLLYEETAGWRFFRSVFYIPQIISPVVIGGLFAVMFSFDGPVNMAIQALGATDFQLCWFGQARTSIPIILLTLVWMNIGWQSLVFLGGMTSIDPSIFDAARIDGCGYFRRLFNVMIPMLVRTLEYSISISIIWVFTSMFPLIFTMTQGGPGYETTTIDYMIYVKAFISGNQLGVACALSVLLAILVTLLTKAQMVFSDKLVRWGGAE